MPTERFYRLPEAKRQAIRAAAIKEFARVPFEKASINQIIQNAEISRGSFYTYFEDKQDVIRYLLEESSQQARQLCEDALAQNGGDYFAMLSVMFDFFVGKLHETQEMLEMAKNVFTQQENAGLIGMHGWPSPSCAEEKDSPIMWLLERLDRSRFRYQDPKDFVPLVTLGMSSVLFALKQYYEYPEQITEIRETFRRSLDLLRDGAYQK